MKKLCPWLVMALVCSGLVQVSADGEDPAERPTLVIAEGRGAPWISLENGRALSGAAGEGDEIPTVLAAADLDGDGLPDLVAAFSGPTGGRLAVHEANLDTRVPFGPRARLRKAAGDFLPEPFLPGPRSVALPISPDLLGTGDFDGDGQVDLVVGERGGTELWWLPGSADGSLGDPRPFLLPGMLSALVTGDSDRRDGRDDIVVATRSAEASLVTLLRMKKEGSFVRSALWNGKGPVDSIAMGRLDRDKAIDLAVGAGKTLDVLLGDDSGRFEDELLHRFEIDATIRSLAFGEFDDGSRHGPGLAILSAEGTLHLVRIAAGFPSLQDLGEVPAEYGTPDSLVALNLSNRPGDDLLLRCAASRGLVVRVGGLDRDAWVSFDTASAPVAVLPMHLNDDPFSDVVALLAEAGEPLRMLTVASQIHAVDSILDDGDADLGDGICATNSGDCTLRAAIDQANAAVGTDAIRFDISGSGPHTIQPLSALPAILDTLLIDATTEPDYAGTPVVELDGSLAGATDGLFLAAGSSSIRGLAVNRFEWTAIAIVGPEAIDNRIQANFIGTDLAGANALGNLGSGVYINEARGTIVGTDGDGVADLSEANLISGNAQDGVIIVGDGTGDNLVAGNLVGTDSSGTSVIPNGQTAVVVINGPRTNRIGTDGNGVGDLEERNILSGNLGHGVLVAGAESTIIAGNYVGTDVTGSVALANNGNGIELSNGANFNRVGTDSDGLSDDLERNVISGNDQSGIASFGEPLVEGNIIAGNYIGVDAGGGGALGNQHNGIYLGDVSTTLVGGSAAEARNLISANAESGMYVWGTTGTGNRIQGNYIGTDVTGNVAMGNVSGGVVIGDSANNVVGTDGDGTADDVEGNLISGNGNQGVLVFGASSQHNVVAGNLIGTDATGTTAIPNGVIGVEVSNGPRYNRIGTNDDGQSDPLERNVISGNTGMGISLFGSPPVEDTLIAGNFIGVQSDGSSPLGNSRHGIFIGDVVNRNLIGGLGVTAGSCDGPCNYIAYNGTGQSLDGVRIQGGTENAVVGNVIHTSTGGAAIDIAAAGMSPNDPGDLDGESNNGQNYPRLTQAITSGGSTTVDGLLDSVASTDFHLEFYVNAACDLNGFGEAETLWGVHEVTTDAGGIASFSVALTPPVPADHRVCATATRMSGTIPTDTSELSACLALGPVTAAGRVPDGDLQPGIPLTMSLDIEPAYVNLAWGDSCMAGDVDYEIYVGTLGDFTSHLPRRCSTEGLTNLRLRIATTDHYFLVVPKSGNREGSYGFDGNGIERPTGADACHLQSIGSCP